MMQPVLTLEPEGYPLSKSMIVRVASDRGIPLAVSSCPHTASSGLSFTADTAPMRERDLLHASSTGSLVTTENWWNMLLTEFQELRHQTSEILSPALQQPKMLSTDWFRETLQEHTPRLEKKGGMVDKTAKEPFSEETLSRWRTRGIVRYEERDMLNYHTAFAVLFMRLADRRRERAFLPPGNFEKDPYMYVWRQDTPNSPVIPCGLPLVHDVPNHALLFTHWQALGQQGQSGWLPFTHLGSVRWRGIREEQGSILWNLSEKDIAMWDPTIISLGEGILDGVAPLMRHTLATMILLKQASRVLQHTAIG